jgi:hypothetical protein
VGRNPSEIEVDDGPQVVSNPGAVFLIGLHQPLRILEKDVRAERRAVCDSIRSEHDPKTTKLLRTRCGGTDASGGVENFLELEVQHGLPDATCEYVSGEADHLLRPCERVDNVVHLRAQVRVAEHGELIEPGVVYEASVAQPVDGEFGVIRIGYDC